MTCTACPSAALVSARTLLASAPLSWSLVAEYESSIIVSVTTRHARDNGVHANRTYLLTSDVEVLRDSWQIVNTWGPELCADDARELTDDVARAFESRVGVRHRDLQLEVV